MANEFEEGSGFYKEHQDTWASFVKMFARGAIFVIILTVLAFVLIAN